MRATINLLSLLFCCFTLAGLHAQMSEPPSVIKLLNPSFEDIPRNSRAPMGWTNCGFPAETPPDVHPDPMNQFQVGMTPQNGSTYLGMVVRDNDTWENHEVEDLQSPATLAVHHHNHFGNHHVVGGHRLEDATDFEHLRNILHRYMTGIETVQCSRVLRTMIKFTPEQVRQIEQREQQQSSAASIFANLIPS